MWRWHQAGLMSKLWVSFKTYNICITAFQKGSFTPVFIGLQKNDSLHNNVTQLRSQASLCGIILLYWVVALSYRPKSKLNPSRSRCSVGFHSHWKRSSFWPAAFQIIRCHLQPQRWFFSQTITGKGAAVCHKHPQMTLSIIKLSLLI